MLFQVARCLLYLVVLTVSSCLLIIFFIRFWLRRRRPLVKTVGFFHPYCNAGGGGERVLWFAIHSLQLEYPELNCVVYTGDVDATEQEILDKARERFGIRLLEPVRLVFLRRRRWIEAERYPRLTLLGQSLGALVLGWEALLACPPHVFLDTLGCPFTLPLFRVLGGCRVGCYVHYPVISTDMLQAVQARTASFNNASSVASSWLLTSAKLLYYRLFAGIYGLVGRASHLTLVNSSWTYGHIRDLWRRPSSTFILYPPCDVESFKRLQNISEDIDDIRIVSVAQFRPEKNHQMQFEVLKLLLGKMEESGMGKEAALVKLVLIGSCRHREDEDRVEFLMEKAAALGVADQVSWRLNLSFPELQSEIARALLGLHTMLNEHFGIGIVEGMAAGNIMVAHDSGGPRMDIVVSEGDEAVGFLADSPESYSQQILSILLMSRAQRDRIRQAAQVAVDKFGEDNFRSGFTSAFETLL